MILPIIYFLLKCLCNFTIIIVVMSVGINTPFIETTNTNYIPVELILGTLSYITVLRNSIIPPNFQFWPARSHVT